MMYVNLVNEKPEHHAHAKAAATCMMSIWIAFMATIWSDAGDNRPEVLELSCTRYQVSVLCRALPARQNNDNSFLGV